MSAPVLVFAACAVACVVAHIAILLSTVRGQMTVAVGTVTRPRAAVEALWALIPVLILALVLTATWARVREQPLRPPEVMKVAR